jgi:hypothetical protein
MNHQEKELAPGLLKILKAYTALSEDNKRAICQTVYRKDPSWFRIWFIKANCTGFREKGAAARPKPIGAMLDAALSKSKYRERLITFIPVCYFSAAHKDWIDYVYARIAGVTSKDIAEKLEAALHSVDAPFAKSEFRDLFIERSLLNPQDWLTTHISDKDATDSVTDIEPLKAQHNADHKAGSSNPLNPSPAHTSLEDDIVELRVLVSNIRASIDIVEAAKQFPVDEAISLIRSAATIGERIRHEIASEFISLNLGAAKWSSTKELEAQFSLIVETKKARELSAVQFLRLRELIDCLKGIVSIRLKSSLQRIKAEEKRMAAIHELENIQKGSTPFFLPGQSNGTTWLREILELSGETFEAILGELEKAGLTNFVEFLSLVESWDRLGFAAPVISGTAEQGADIAHSAPVIAAVSDSQQQSSPNTIDAPPVTPSPAAIQHEEQLRQPLNDGITNTTVIDQSTQIAQREIESAVILSSITDTITNRDEELLVNTSEKLELKNSVIEQPQDKCSSNFREHLEAMARYSCKYEWAVCSQYAKLLQGTGIIAAPNIFNTLALLPYVAVNNSNISEEIRKQLNQCESPDKLNNSVGLVVWCAGLVSSGLLVPFSAAGSLLRSLHWPEKLSALHELCQATIALLDSVPHCSAQLLQGSQPRQIWESNIRLIASEADSFEREALKLSMLYQPATESWKYLVKHGVVGDTIRQLCISNGNGNRKKVEEFLRVSANQREILKLVHNIHRLREPRSRTRIEARAIPQFESKINPLRDIAQKWLYLSANIPQASGAVSEKLGEYRGRWSKLSEDAIASVRNNLSGNERQIAVSALNRAFDCINHATEGTLVTETALTDSSDILVESLLRVPTLNFDRDRNPVGSVSDQLEALDKSSGNLIPLRTATEQRIAARDDLGAKHAIELIATRGGEGIETLRNALEQLVVEKRSELNTKLKAARRQASRARLAGMIGESDSARLEAAFVSIEKDSRNDDLLQSTLELIAKHTIDLDEKTKIGKKNLLAEVSRVVKDQTDRERLEKLIQIEDASTVHEYLARLEAGQKLPKEDSRDLQPFAGFNPERQKELLAAFSSGGELDGLRSAIRSGHSFAGTDFSKFEKEERQRDVNWIDTWIKIKSTQLPETERVEVILSGLGYVVQSVTSANRGNQLISEAKVEPLCDRALCPIPRFGSLAGGVILIRHVWDWTDEESVVQAIGDTIQHVHLNLVILYGRLGPERRLALARTCRLKRRSFLVLDELLLTHLCSKNEARLGAFFRSTTPYTYADPFVTASSLVHPEMFFGRDEELAALLSSDNGRCFVYGGRQLGKTALLLEAERRFHNPKNEAYAVWIDLLNYSIGRERPPRYVWEVIHREMARWPGFPEINKTIAQKSDKGVPELIESWMEANPTRRVLLLLDEADRFLEEDAREDFMEARRLKGLMDRTQRKFKVVFAGLHNVQRTTQQANHPLAHLGNPIKVGALSDKNEWYSAFALASEPLTALGVQFSSVDLVGRILTVCNFYPGLIQQFCSRMWRGLLEKRVEGPPYLITETELDEVYQNELRLDIVGRFKLTLQLDPRYWHLAHVVALQFLEERSTVPEGGYSVTELRDLAMEWWSDGFSGNSLEEFRSLLDEMCDLGVLRESSGKYSIRNANILLLLGTKAEVETEVINGPRLIAEYKPRSFRARFRQNQAITRRPLTLTEEARLCDPSNGIAFIIGSQALGIQSVGESLSEVADASRAILLPSRIRDETAFKIELTNIASSSRTSGDGLFLVWVSASLKWDMQWVNLAREYCERLRSPRRFVRILFEVGPDQLWNPNIKLPQQNSDRGEKLLILKKWNRDFIAPYLVELGVPATDDTVSEVLTATGGWPEFVHELARRFVQIGDWRRALLSLSERPVITAQDAPTMFLGCSVEAQAATAILKRLYSSLNDGEAIHDSDISEYADLFGVSPSHLQHVIATAATLSVFDRSQIGFSSWDPVFENIVLT